MDYNGEQQKEGIALTLCLEEEYIYLCRIEGFIDKSIKKRELPQRTYKKSSNYRGNKPRSNQYRRRSDSDNRQVRQGGRPYKKNRGGRSKSNDEDNAPVRKLPFF
jgi:superfamily II DNA/RNA helicase